MKTVTLEQPGRFTLTETAPPGAPGPGEVLVRVLTVGIHAVGRAAPQPGERAIVVGAGPIGLSVIEFLRLAGADIAVVEKMPERLEFAARHHGLQRYYPSHAEALQEEPSLLVFDC